MPNPQFSEFPTDRKHKSLGDNTPKGKPNVAFREKPGFMTGLPGKAQKGDRSGGVKKCKCYPSSQGL